MTVRHRAKPNETSRLGSPRRQFRRGFLMATLATGVALAAVGCGSGSSKSPGGGSGGKVQHTDATLVVGVPTLAAQYVDPGLANGNGNNYPTKWSVGEQLVFQTLDNTLEPALAKSWTISPDKLTWTFKLREGVKMQDGSAFTAQDVATSIDRIGTGADWAIYARFKALVATVTVVDPLTIDIKTKMPFANVPQSIPAPVATDYYKKVGEDAFRKHPIAAGPMKFVSQKINDSVTLERFDGFWDKSRLPNFKTLVLKIIPDENAVVSALRSGQIDVAQQLTANGAEGLKGVSGIQMVSTPDTAQAAIYFPGSKSNPALSKPAVRKALLMAIDRDAIAKSLYKGYATVPANVTLPATTGDDPALKVVPFDPAGAKKILQENGAGNLSFTLHLGFPGPMPYVDQLAQAVIGYWDQVGVKAKLTLEDTAALGPSFAAGKFDGSVIMVANPAERKLDPIDYGFFFSSMGAFSTVKDPTLDKMFGQVSQAVDPAEKAAKGKTIFDYIYDNVLAVGVLNSASVSAFGPKVQSYTPMVANPFAGPFYRLVAKP